MEDRSDDMPASKKRVAGREISRDNPGLDDDNFTPEEETGTFKKASEEVLATRRIIRVKRNQPTSAPTSNPFSSVCLVPPPADIPATISETPVVPPTNGKELRSEVDQVTVSEEIVSNTADTEPAAPLASTDKLIEEQSENVASAPEELSETAGKSSETKNASDEPLAVESTINAETDVSPSAVEITGDVPEDVNGAAGETAKGTLDESDKVGEPKSGISAAAPVNLFQELSGSQNAFTGFSGSGFSSQPFSFGTSPSSFSFSSGSSAFSSGSASLFGSQLGNSSAPSFGFGNSFSPFGADAARKSSDQTPKPVLHEVPIETGEEKEKAVFVADAVLFEYLDGGWKERGKGELKLNVPSEGIGKVRLVMRSKGNLRLILNANLYPEMKLAPMDKRGVTFACVNSAGEGKAAGLATFALKLKDSTLVEAFQEALNSHKGEQTQAPKTPENSPKTGDV